MRPLLLLFLFVFAPVLTFAQSDSDTFQIRFFAGNDTEPPTTPTLISANPIGPTQVDLAWTTVTDNFAVGGYVVFRGIGTTSTSTIAIATTTLTTYSDVGLTPSTTYRYEVRAFDTNANYSSSSNQLSVFTPGLVVNPSAASEPEGTVTRVVADEVKVTPAVATADFNVTTKTPARLEIRWGRTAAYELGYIASEIAQRDYSTTITDLEPGTVYEYEIIGYTPFGRSNVVKRGKFKTLDYVDLVAPANVKRFTATANVADVNLSWQLPNDDDIAYVRIVRSHLGYPVNPLDGATVYSGLGTGAVDSGVLLRYSPVYYTAFVYDTTGNISSGAVAIVFANNVPANVRLEGEEGSIPVGGIGSELSTTTLLMPKLGDFVIRQGNRKFSYEDVGIELSHTEPFLIHLPADRITKSLKTIVVDLQDPTDQRQSFSFLLRLNKDQTAYEATIASLEVVGKASLTTNIYDFEYHRVAEYVTQIVFMETTQFVGAEELRESDQQLFWLLLSFVGSLFLVLLWWILAKDRDEDKETEIES